MAEEKRVTDYLYCSFCGKERREVRKLITGGAVFICDECVWQCAALIKETQWETNKGTLMNLMNSCEREAEELSKAIEGLERIKTSVPLVEADRGALAAALVILIHLQFHRGYPIQGVS